MTGPEWIAADWGGSHLRLWAMDGTQLTATLVSDAGTGGLARDAFEPALLDLAAPWLTEAPVQVVACGMLGARQGWVEAPYATVPCAPQAGAPVRAPARDPRLTVWVLPGLRQDAPADVMRGEETQIAGFLARNPGYDGVICLPGTHSKWAHVSAGDVVSFQSFLTGELFALLSGSSVLRHTIAPDGWDDAAFAEAVSDTLSRPERLAARLFGLRAEALLHGLDGATARARLSGWLIGAELAASRPYWLGRAVAVIGAQPLARRYADAIAAQGVAPIQTDAAAMTRAGLIAARRNIEETLP